MAMDARIEWAQMTNLFGSGKKQGAKEKPTASNVADKLRMALTGRRAK
ncbi:hypothetical protein [Pseudomonas monteilii]|nr:hypothetical protein [Pseudomonas monteilii]